MADADLYGLLMGDEPSAQEKTQALAAALRGQTQRGNRMEALGLVSQLSGDDVLGKAAPALMASGRNQMDMSQTGGQQLLAALKQRQAAAQQQAELSEQAKRDANTERHQTAQEGLQRAALAQGKYSQGAFGVLNNRTGELDAYSKPTAGPKEKDINADFGKLADAVSTYRGRGNLNRENQSSLQRAEALEALLQVPDLNSITPQQMREASTSLAGLISRGGSQAVSQIEHLTPESYAGKFADFKQKLLNEPQGADAKAFLQNMLETASREKGLIKKQIRNGQLQGVPNFAHLKKVDPERFSSILTGAGLDPSELDDNGLVKAAQMAASSGSMGSGKIKVSNGKETLEIDPADESDAAKDGFRRL